MQILKKVMKPLTADEVYYISKEKMEHLVIGFEAQANGSIIIKAINCVSKFAIGGVQPKRPI